MSRFDSARLLFIRESRLVNQQVGAFSYANGSFGRTRVSGKHHAAARSRRTDEVSRRDYAPIVKSNCLSFVKLAPRGAFRDSHLPRPVGIESSETNVFDERVTHRRLVLVIDRVRKNRVTLSRNRRVDC